VAISKGINMDRIFFEIVKNESEIENLKATYLKLKFYSCSSDDREKRGRRD